jgi:hypothetical protein
MCIQNAIYGILFTYTFVVRVHRRVLFVVRIYAYLYAAVVHSEYWTKFASGQHGFVSTSITEIRRGHYILQFTVDDVLACQDVLHRRNIPRIRRKIASKYISATTQCPYNIITVELIDSCYTTCDMSDAVVIFYGHP